MNPLRKPSKISAYLFALVAAVITIAIVFYPEQTFEASLDGLKLWWDVVFPALMPFFIISEILMGLGVVHFLGALLEPLMQPLFGVPGVGGFVMAIGLASGYPIGAKITAKLREQKLCSQLEAERLVCFTNTADPLFMVGAVAVGMFHDVRVGSTIAAAHYISSLMVGLTMRFWGRKDSRKMKTTRGKKGIIQRALHDLYEARVADGRPIGKLLGDAVTSSVNTGLFVGGFIILFSVLVKVLVITGVVELLAAPVTWLLQPFGISSEIVYPLVSGICEIDLGAHHASLAPIGLKLQLVLASFIIAWSGLSVHGQVAAIISSTDMRYAPYFWARILHGFYAGLITYIIYDPAKPALTNLPHLWEPFNSYWKLNMDLLSARLLTVGGVLLTLVLVALLISSAKKVAFDPSKKISHF